MTTTLAVWYSRLTATWSGPGGAPRPARGPTGDFVRRANKARSKDHLAAVAKLTTKVDGALRL